MFSEESLVRTKRNGPVSFGQWPTAEFLPEQIAFPSGVEVVHLSSQCNSLIVFAAFM